MSIIGALKAELPDLVRQIVREELAAQQAGGGAGLVVTATGERSENPAPAPADGPETPGDAPAGTTGPEFDPGAHNVTDVNTYLDGLREAGNDAEVDRVLAAERAGQARKGVLGA